MSQKDKIGTLVVFRASFLEAACPTIISTVDSRNRGSSLTLANELTPPIPSKSHIVGCIIDELIPFCVIEIVAKIPTGAQLNRLAVLFAAVSVWKDQDTPSPDKREHEVDSIDATPDCDGHPFEILPFPIEASNPPIRAGEIRQTRRFPFLYVIARENVSSVPGF